MVTIKTFLKSGFRSLEELRPIVTIKEYFINILKKGVALCRKEIQRYL